MEQCEVLPVPPELVPRVWRSTKTILSKIPGYNVERTHMRLLAGVDQLWVAYGLVPSRNSIDPNGIHILMGAIITSVSSKPPQERKAYQRKDKALMRSLTIHLAGERMLLSWLDSAIERINRYAREHDCRMLFILARKGWQRHLKRWWSKEWELVAMARDRSTVSKHPLLRRRNTPGYFRALRPVPADKFNRNRYTIMRTCDFKVEASA